MTFDEWFGKRVGLVLNGGGGKGAYQVGAFKALYEAGLTEMITDIAGTSVGALNMALFVQDNQKLAEEIWCGISPEEFIDPEFSMIDGKEGIVSRDGLIRIMDNKIDISKISNSRIKLYATVTEYSTDGKGAITSGGRAKYLPLNGESEERIKNILLATSSVPFLYEPVFMDQMAYKDGGLVDNLPIKVLYDDGVRNFIVILLGKDRKVPVEQYPDCQFLIITPSVELGDLVTGTFDFTSVGAMRRIELGYMDAARTIRFYGDETTNVSEIAEIENRALKGRVIIDTAMNSANENMSKLNDLIGKYINDDFT